jgi:hypothetical protein
LLKLVPTSQVVYGTDYPYAPGIETTNGLAASGVPAGTLAAIGRQSALGLFARNA